jgi:hypothetical protein
MLAFGLLQAVAAEKPKNPKPQTKKEDKSTLGGNFAIQHGTRDLQKKKTKGVKSN